jgi:hypothetical protein
MKVKQFIWFEKDPQQPEDEVYFASDIERLLYLTGV